MYTAPVLMGCPSGQHWYDVDVSSRALRFSQERGAGLSDRTGRVPLVSSLYGHGTCRITCHGTALSRACRGVYTISADRAPEGSEEDSTHLVRPVECRYGRTARQCLLQRPQRHERRAEVLLAHLCGLRNVCACGLHQPRVAYVKRMRTRWLTQPAETAAPLPSQEMQRASATFALAIEQSLPTPHEICHQQHSEPSRQPLQPAPASRARAQRAEPSTLWAATAHLTSTRHGSTAWGQTRV